MAFDEGLAEILRGDLAELSGVAEKRMFGGLVFMLDGNLLCGVHPDGAMYRVGKANHAAALALPGVRPMAFTGRPMGGFVDAGEAAIGDDANRAELMRLALEFVRSLPPK